MIVERAAGDDPNIADGRRSPGRSERSLLAISFQGV